MRCINVAPAASNATLVVYVRFASVSERSSSRPSELFFALLCCFPALFGFTCTVIFIWHILDFDVCTPPLVSYPQSKLTHTPPAIHPTMYTSFLRNPPFLTSNHRPLSREIPCPNCDPLSSILRYPALLLVPVTLPCYPFFAIHTTYPRFITSRSRLDL